MKIIEQKEINSLLSKVYQTNPYILIFYPIKNQSYFFDSISKLTEINQSQKTLTFLTEDDREILLEKRPLLLNSMVKSCFIMDELRYTFESELLEIIEIKKSIFQVTIKIPIAMDSRKNRKYPRVAEKKISLSKDVHFSVKDISIGGIGLIVRKSESNCNEGDHLTVELGIPYLSESTSLYHFLALKMKCVRKTDHIKNYELLGLEFEKIDSFDESIIYQYMISRKNEILFQTNELLPIKCVMLSK